MTLPSALAWPLAEPLAKALTEARHGTDTVPDAFGFVDQSDVDWNSTITSAAIVVAGITGPTPISITGGTYSINGGAYTGTAGTVVNGDQVAVRHTSANARRTATNTILTIGGVSDTFTSTTSYVNGLGAMPYFHDFTRGTVVADTGQTLGYTRASASNEQDFEGLIRGVLSGEARFWKLRRVENLLNSGGTSKPASLLNATLDSVIDDPAGTTLAGRYTITNGASFQIYTVGTTVAGSALIGALSVRGVGASIGKTVSLWIYDNGSTTTATITLTGSYQRVQIIRATATGGNDTRVGLLNGGTIATNDKVDIAFLQLEATTGAAIQVAGEYVSKGVLSTPYHGASVDGVKYFATANGNTVASNVVTEATGSALTLTGAGARPQPAHTNICLQSENFGTTWAAIGATTPTRSAAAANCGAVVLDLLGDDSAVLAEGYTQTIAFTGNAAKAVSIFVKGGTSAASYIRLRDNTALANRLSLDISWSGGVPTPTAGTGTVEGVDALALGVYRIRCITSSVTAANTNVLEVYPATTNALGGGATGDAHFGGVMVQDAAACSVYVKTTTASVTVNADTGFGVASGGTINATEGTLYGKFIVANGPGNATVFSLDDGTLNNYARIRNPSSGGVLGTVTSAGSLVADMTGATPALDSVAKAALRYRLNDFAISVNGAAAVTDTSGAVPTMTQYRNGITGNDGNTVYGGVLQEAGYSATGATNANLALAAA